MGLAILIEVTGFAFMAIFISRLGTTPVAGHQIAANLVSLLFMMPLALGNATSTLVAQRIGAGRLPMTRAAWAGTACVRRALAALVWQPPCLRRAMWCSALYTANPAVIAAPPCRCWPGWRCSTWPTRRRPWPLSCCAPGASPPCPW
jgi:MATE family multidrug resistance protein